MLNRSDFYELARLPNSTKVPLMLFCVSYYLSKGNLFSFTNTHKHGRRNNNDNILLTWRLPQLETLVLLAFLLSLVPLPSPTHPTHTTTCPSLDPLPQLPPSPPPPPLPHGAHTHIEPKLMVSPHVYS